MAPWAGNARGYISAIIALCIGSFIAASVSEKPEALFTDAWPLITFIVGWLMLCLMLTLMIRAFVTTCKLLFFSNDVVHQKFFTRDHEGPRRVFY